MKFHAVMQDPQFMREFQNISTTLSKLSKECVMNISRDRIYFIANEESGTTAPLVWVDIDAKLYFSKYTMETKETQPHILLSISSLHLARALGVLRNNPRQCKITLVRMQFPCLTIEADVISQTSDQPRKIQHHVPVELIPRSDWPHYELPRTPSCKLVMNVPFNRLTRGLIDKIKNLSPSVTFHGTSVGELNLVAETDMATITTRCKDLELLKVNASPEDKGKAIIETSCAVDCKKAAIFFAALHLPAEVLACGIAPEHLIHFEVNIREGVAMHSILPAISNF